MAENMVRFSLLFPFGVLPSYKPHRQGKNRPLRATQKQHKSSTKNECFSSVFRGAKVEQKHSKNRRFSPGPISRSNPPFEAADLRGSFADGQTPRPAGDSDRPRLLTFVDLSRARETAPESVERRGGIIYRPSRKRPTEAHRAKESGTI